MERRRAIFCVVLCALISIAQGQAKNDDIDGGTDGTNGNQHLKGKAEVSDYISHIISYTTPWDKFSFGDGVYGLIYTASKPIRLQKIYLQHNNIIYM